MSVTLPCIGMSNHQTLRATPLNALCSGIPLGYWATVQSVWICQKEDLRVSRRRSHFIRNTGNVWQFGDFYRVESGNHYQWNVGYPRIKDGYRYDHAKRSAAKYHVQEISGAGLIRQRRPIILSGCRASIISRNLGDLVNTAAPDSCKTGFTAHYHAC